MTPKELRNHTLDERWDMFVKQYNLMLRYNTLTQETFIKASSDTEWVVADDQTLAPWRNRAKSNYGIKNVDFYSYIQEMELLNKYNPLTELLDESEWDGKNRSDKMLEAVIGNDNNVEKSILKKWLVNSLHQWHAREQSAQPTLVLQGLEGIEKSQFVEWLASPFVKAGCETQDILPDPSNPNHLHMRSTSIFWEITDLSCDMNERQSESLKRFLSARDVKLRPLTGRQKHYYRPLTCFIATTNNLGNIAGSRHFLPILLKQQMNRKHYAKLDAKQLWLEFYDIYKSNNRQMLDYTKEENHYISVMRESYTEDPLYFNVIARRLVNNNDTGIITTEHLREYLLNVDKKRSVAQKEKDIAKVMRKLGAIKIRRRYNNSRNPVSCWTGWQVPTDDLGDIRFCAGHVPAKTNT